MTEGLCAAFQDLGDQTRRRIKAAHDSGMRWSEESNTEHLLLALSTQFPAQVAISAFTKKREAANGADWEWWFIGASGAYGMRIQAKRITLPNEIFGHLRHRAKGQSRDQMTALIEEAEKDGLTPAYCFYTMSPGGCLVGHAQVIQNAGSNRLRKLTPYLLPWHWLVCDGSDAADIAEVAEVAMRDATERGQTGQKWPSAAFWTPLLASRYRPMPEYVKSLVRKMDSGDVGLAGWTAASALPDAPSFKRIRGVAVFRGTGH